MIRFQTLGALHLRDADDRELRLVLAQPKRVALLAYLALARPRGPHRRDRLVAMFWPEHDDDHARNSLSQAVRFLRRFLGDGALVGRTGAEIALADEHVWCDAVAFDAALDAGRPNEAIAMYRGELLDGFHVADIPEFQRWLDSERALVSGRYAAALEGVGEDRERRGDFAGAVTCWRQLAARDLLSSRIALRLMRALAAAGDPGAAAQHARVHEALLRDELGVAPDPTIAALVRQLSSVQRHSSHGRNEIAPPAIAIVSEPPRTDTGVVTSDGSDATRIASASNTLPAPRYPAMAAQPRWRVRAAVAAVGLALLLAVTLNLRLQEAEASSYLKDLYDRGRQAENSRSLVGLQTAKAAYSLAIERDSTFALAYAGLAGVHGFMGDYAFAPVGPSLDTARRLAIRAVTIDSSSSDTRLARAITLGDAGELDAAEHEFRRAIEIDATNGRAHYWYAVLLVALGRGDAALAELALAEQYDRFPPRGLRAMKRYATWLTNGTRPDRGLPVNQRRSVLTIEPGEPWARAREALDLAEVGQCSDARKQLREAELLAPDNFRMFSLAGSVYWWCGEKDRTRQLLDSMKRRTDASDHGYRVALLHVLFSEPDSAMPWLEQHRWTMAELAALSASHHTDPLRSYRRYDDLLERLGLRTPATARRQ